MKGDAAHNMTCPDDETLSGFLLQQMSGKTSDVLAEHVESCDHCRDALAGLARGSPATPRPATTDVAPETRIGRYEVETPLGMGGMGIVFRARDVELGRKVAIKLVRTSSTDGEGDRRLLLEAKAMAALQHPNVVTLYDFGEHAGQVYLAMELVTQTLREWLGAGSRSWRQIASAFEQAARGLQAAHELGIVHRDFKPDNVFIGDDGRVRVGDFGLARAGGNASAVAGSDGQLSTVMGTVRYMAPEQLSGKRADARSDQFSFSVALYEALYGTLPFGDGTLATLRAAYEEGREPAFPSKVPGWLARIVERGLRIEPAQRFPSMAQLIDALTVAPQRRKRRVIAASAIAAIAVSSGIAFALGDDGTAADPCSGGAATLATVYGPDVEGTLAARFAASASPSVRDMGPRFVDRVRGYTSRWVAMHGETCRATVVQGKQSPELMDLRMACLDERLRETDALLGALANAKDDGLKLAIEATGRLTPLEACADERALRAQLAPPPLPATVASIELVREHIRSAKFYEATGDFNRALSLARTALDVATSAGYAPVKAEALFQVGLGLGRLERGAEASEHFHQAAITAEAARHDDVAAQARVALVMNLGLREGKFAEAEQTVPYAKAAVERAGSRPQMVADLLLNHAAILNRTGRPDAALPLSLEALAVLERAASRDDIQLGRVYNRIANDMVNVGQYEGALPYFDKALASYERAVGNAHPHVANVLTNRGGALRYLARYDEAAAHQRRAVEIRERAFGAEHPEVAAGLTNLSNTLHGMGKRDEAYALRVRALAIAEAKLPPTHSNVIIMRLNVLDSLMQLKHDAKAAELCDHWLPIERKERADRISTARWMAACAVSYLRLERTTDAWEVYRAAATQIANGKDAVSEDYLVPFAQELLARGQATAALPLLDRALAHSRKTGGDKHPDTIALAKVVDEARAKATLR